MCRIMASIQKNRLDSWTEPDQEVHVCTMRESMPCIHADGRHRSPFGELPVVCNYFYHEGIIIREEREKRKTSEVR